MADIYRSAERVLVWLGPALDEELAGWFGDLRTSSEDGPAISKLLDTSDSSSTRGLEVMPHWHRVWTVQEFLLAREIMVVYGDVRVPFGVLEQGLEERDPVDLSFESTAKPSNMISLWRQHADLADADLKSLLYLNNSRHCKESHDRVYSLLHVATDRENLEITLDYTQSKDALFLAVLSSVSLTLGETIGFALMLTDMLGIGNNGGGQEHMDQTNPLKPILKEQKLPQSTIMKYYGRVTTQAETRSHATAQRS